MWHRENFKYHQVLFSVLLGCALITHDTKGQGCDLFAAQADAQTGRLAVRESRDLSRKDLRKNLKSIQDGLQVEMSVQMAEKILVEVNSTTTTSIVESGMVYSDFFNSETKIQTTASLADGKIDYCIDEKSKTLYAIYSLDRAKTAQAVIKDCENRMEQLKNEFSKEISVRFDSDLDRFEQRKQGIKRDARMATFLDPREEQSKLNMLFSAYDNLVTGLVNNRNQGDFIDRFTTAQLYIQSYNFEQGISALRALKLEYPRRNEVTPELESAEKKYEVHVQRGVSNLEAQQEYRQALELLDTYCKTMPCPDGKQHSNLRAFYFGQEYVKFDKAIKYQLSNEVENHFLVLRRLASANEKGFERAMIAYEKFRIDKEMAQIQDDLDRRNYYAAYNKAKQVQYNYDTSYGSFQNLLRNTANALLKSEIRNEKQTRDKIFAIVAGLEAVGNRVNTLTEVSDLSTFSFAYSFGLYTKFRYTNRSVSGYHRSSDMVGIKFRLIDMWNTQWVVPTDGPTPSVPYRYDSELLVDGTLFQYFHFSGGIMFPNKTWENGLWYSMELGLRAPFGPISLQVNVRYVNTTTTSFYGLNGGIFGQFDFWRKFNAKDKKAIKRKLGM